MKITKLKTLLPTLKEKKRYLVFEVIGKKSLTDSDINEIRREIELFLGVDQAADAGLQFTKTEGNKLMLRVSPKYIDKTKVALLLVNKLNDKEVIIKTIGASGIVKKAQTKYMRGEGRIQ